MSWRALRIVYGKELRDSLRDRRTLVSMVVVPVVAMPLLMLGTGVLMVKTVNQAMEEIPKVMLIGAEHSPKVIAALKDSEAVRIVPYRVDFTNQIIEKRIRAAVEIPDDFDAIVARGDPARIRIYDYAGEFKSGVASEDLDHFFRNFRDATVRERLKERGLSPHLLTPFEIVRQNVAPPAKVSGSALGGMIPYMLMILCMIGAMYPAIDLTAGEKERGTMETILCSPVSRTDLVLGKFLTVLTASLATVVLSLLSMGATFRIGLHVLAGAVPPDAGKLATSLDPAGIAAAFLLLLPVAAMFSAGLLAVSLFARSFREAQSYASPLMMLVILPAIFGILPGVELNARLALIPLVNASLACKDVVAGSWHWSYLLLIFGSSCVYAALALAWAVWLFQREEVVFRT